MKTRIASTLWIVFSLTVSGQTRTPAAQEKSSAASGIAQEFAAAANAKDAARVAMLYQNDAVLMPPNGEAVRGRSSIQAFWQNMLDQGARDISVEITGSAASGSVSYEAGTYQFTMPSPGGQPVTDRGKYLVGMKRDRDGKWRIAYDIFNSDLPCSAPPK